MKKLLTSIVLATACSSPSLASVDAQTIFHFSPQSQLNSWLIVNDGVMGGLSDGKFILNEQGHGLFYGDVSLENNGGFTSVRHTLEKPLIVNNNQKISIRLKGDGKRYQFRVRGKSNQRHSYVTHFNTTGEWQTIEINLGSLYPTFHGRNLDMPNFDQEHISQIMFLIANKKAEKFELIIESLGLK